MARFEPARLTEVLTLVDPVGVPDGQGGVTISPVARARLRASITPSVSRIEERDGRIVAVLESRVVLRARADLRPGLVLEKPGRRMTILSVLARTDGPYADLVVEEEGP